jgi:predicted nucleic acid-binding protein
MYIDTSVFGGCFEPEFQEASKALLQEVRTRQTTAVISDIVLDELRNAPTSVRDLLKDLPHSSLEILNWNEESRALAKHYLEAKVVPPHSHIDAQHVALATVARVDAIVSWNFKHIVNLKRIHGFNGVNIIHGYRAIDICSPKVAVLQSEENDD